MGFFGFLTSVMPKARFLAPWHRADVLEKLRSGDLSAEDLAGLGGKPAIYHCISRVVDRRFVLGEPERERFVAYMRLYERFCQLRVLSFCVMSNHFHILLEVPSAPDGRGADWSDGELLEHLSHLYSKERAGALRRELEHYRKQGNTEAAEAFRERYFRRMWDLSQFMKTLKQRFTRWFNRRHERKGTLWEERFKSVLVEDGHAARTMAAYIDLNPVRAGMADDPKDYRWCSYAEAVAGRERSREGLQRVMFELESMVTSEERAAAMLLSWRKAAHRYRRILHIDLKRGGPERDPEKARKAPQLTEAQALRCRVRYFVDGMALGTGAFIERVFGLSRERFSSGRKSGARKLRRIDTPLRTLRDLQAGPVVT